MSIVDVVGFDPSLSNWGCVEARIGIRSEKPYLKEILRMGVIKTSPDKRKGIRKSTSDIHRSATLSKNLIGYLDSDYIFAEAPYGSQSFQAAVSYGVCVALLGAIEATGKTIQTLTPQAIKLYCTGNRNADKDQMLEWALQEYPSEQWPTRKVKGEQVVIKGTAEHLADAVATIHTGIQTPEFINFLKYKGLL